MGQWPNTAPGALTQIAGARHVTTTAITCAQVLHAARRQQLPRRAAGVTDAALLQGYSFASGAGLNSDAFIIGGATHGTSVARLRESGATHWDTLPGCLTPRLHSAAVACFGHLFVLVRRGCSCH